jgi:hypothetical protein
MILGMASCPYNLRKGNYSFDYVVQRFEAKVMMVTFVQIGGLQSAMYGDFKFSYLH